MAEKNKLVLAEKSVELSSPKELATFANTLKSFVVSNKLFTNIQSKNYVHVEGWQFAGASMGIFPVVKETENISSGDEIKYRARVELVRLADGIVVGAAESVCSSREAKRRNADEYVIQSMAQTRATGKAFRMCIGWVMKLAGYEATPKEEVQEDVVEVYKEGDMPIEDVKQLVNAKLESMKPADKIRIIKQVSGTVSQAKMSDDNYRRMYHVLRQSTEQS